jgi:hypothetical protein
MLDNVRLTTTPYPAMKLPSMAISLHASPAEANSLMSPFEQLRPRTEIDSDVREELSPCSCGLAREVGTVKAYNEEAFRYFLAIERERSEISSRPFLLLLADLKKLPGMNERIQPALAGMLFSALWLALRETDFIGWYHEGRVAGAVLTQRSDIGGTDMSRLVRERVARVMSQHLPKAVTARLQVRVYQLPPRLEGRG